MNLYLQNIVNSIQSENLPQEWLDFDFVKFSNQKKLFDYQQQALKNAAKSLYKFYVDFQGDKKQFWELYHSNGLSEDLDIKVNDNKKLKIYEDFDKDFPVENDKIPFWCFINRMSFWMATGSGKTLVIVKLIELLAKLIQSKQIPENDILFLTYREDLIEQFKNHINEFNSSNQQITVELHNLKDYDKIKKENCLTFGNSINVFYYRSDLIYDEQKDKIINFKNYESNGKWYILLDEAHKGDKEDSKRQHYYSILSRNGFLFNFSATFTDPIDFATCVFNFNLEQFVLNGYGKHIYISQSNISQLGQKEDFNEQEKQKIILKTLLLKTYIKQNKNNVRKYYHNPLILTLVNSINTEDSDLYLFFKEIEKVAQQKQDENLLSLAKQELLDDLKGKFEFENETIDVIETDIQNITFNDILKNVFNAESAGKIEVLKIPGNRQEIIFKLTTSDKPFALIKIGDISEWLKNKLSGYEIIEKFDNESIFKNISKDDSDINILMGSRAFYEGWDSNRPNVILYINIGKGTDARKFVLQSIGRGVRIEPLPDKRKRLQFLYNNSEIPKEEFDNIKDYVKPIETLFVYGTKSENLKEVIETLKQEKQEELIGDLFQVNPDVVDKILLIPIYRESEKILADEKSVKFEISKMDHALVKNYFNYIGEKIALVKFDCEPKLLNILKESFHQNQDYYKIVGNVATLNKPEILIKNIFKHFSIRTKEFKEFKKLENEIIHFKQIKLTEPQREKFEEKIKKVLNYKNKDKEIQRITEKIQREPQKATEYVKEIEHITKNYVSEETVEYNSEKVKVKYLLNHYYLPVIMSEDDKEQYLKHIIKTRSEKQFIEELENYLQQENNIFKNFDWWFFSKIDETLDEVYIPYYQPKTNKIEKFKPDFIFWLKKGNNYTILFVDPKGTEYADGYRKIDGYSKIFEVETNGQKSTKYFFYRNEIIINVRLLLKTRDGLKNVLETYKRYWFESFTDFEMKLQGIIERTNFIPN